MTPELAQKLYATYPEVFPPYTGFGGGTTPFEQRGFEVDDGWFDIIENMARRLQVLGVAVSQVKQKFGPLRVYVDDVSEENRDQIQAIVAEACEVSKTICEKCGAPGSLVSRRNWLLIACEPCLSIPKE